MKTTPNNPQKKGALPRRHLLIGSAVTGVGAAIAGGTATLIDHSTRPGDPPTYNGQKTEPFYGQRQSGIDTPPQAHSAFVGLDLRDGVDADGLRRLLRLLSDDAARLTQGLDPAADMETELSTDPARLTVTFGFGPRVFEVTGHPTPRSARALPAFTKIDQLREEYGGTDLLVCLATDDPLTLSHSQRMILKDSRAFASTRWIQTGFRRAHGTEDPARTTRNLFGQLDGSANERPGTDEYERIVWGDAAIPPWRPNGTSLVLRRIAMNLDKWDELDRDGREEAVGRRLSDGAPLTGSAETDEPDFEAPGPVGFPIIAPFSHMRRARPDNPRQRIYRRAYNYEVTTGAKPEAGLLFTSFQADIDQQFIPIQQRLNAMDLLNEWTTPIGSAVYAIGPGCQEGSFVGDWLFH